MSKRPEDLSIGGYTKFHCEADGRVWVSWTQSIDMRNMDIAENDLDTIRDWCQAALDYKLGPWIPKPGECFTYKSSYVEKIVYRRVDWGTDLRSHREEYDRGLFTSIRLDTGLMVKVGVDELDLEPAQWTETADGETKTTDKTAGEDHHAIAVGKGAVAFGWAVPSATPETFPGATQPEPKKPWIPKPGEFFELRGLTYCRAEEGSVAAELANDEQFAAKNIETGNDIWVRLDAENLELVREAVQRNDEEPSTSEPEESNKPGIPEPVLDPNVAPTKPWIPEPGEAWKYKGRSKEVYIRLKNRLDPHAEGRFSSVRPGKPSWARYVSTALNTPNLEPADLNEDVDRVG